MEYLSRDRVKTLLFMNNTHNDNYIDEMIPIVIAIAEDYCGVQLAIRDNKGVLHRTTEGYAIVDASLLITFSKMIEYYQNRAGVSYESIGRVINTYSQTLPEYIKDQLDRFSKNKLKFF